MAKQGMKRPEITHTHPKNDITPVPELQGKAKHTKQIAKPVSVVSKKTPHRSGHSPYDVFDNEVAIENLENDLSAADLQDS